MTQWRIAIMLLKIIALRRIKILEPHAFVFFCAIYNTLFIDVFLFKLKCDPSKFLSRLRLILCFVKLNHAWKATAMQNIDMHLKTFLENFWVKKYTEEWEHKNNIQNHVQKRKVRQTRLRTNRFETSTSPHPDPLFAQFTIFRVRREGNSTFVWVGGAQTKTLS